MKEGDIASKFYFIHKGMCEILVEFEDFLYFNYEEVEKFIAHKESDALYQKMELEEKKKNSNYDDIDGDEDEIKHAKIKRKIAFGDIVMLLKAQREAEEEQRELDMKQSISVDDTKAQL